MPSLIRLGKRFLADAEGNLNISMHEFVNAIQFSNSLNYPYVVTSQSHAPSLFIFRPLNDFGGSPNLFPLWGTFYLNDLHYCSLTLPQPIPSVQMLFNDSILI